MKIEIDSEHVEVKGGTNARGAWEKRTQLGYLDTGKRYPAEIKIRLKEGRTFYPVGSYEIDLAASTYVSKYGSVALSEELVLIPLQAKPAKAA